MARSFRSLIRRPIARLALFAAASLAIYLAALVRPYSLFEWWNQPGLTIAKITNQNAAAGALFVVATLALFLLYWLACRLTLRSHTRQAWGIVLLGALAFNLALLCLYPVEAADLFDYAMRGRMQSLYGQNPFYQRPSSTEAVRNDPLYPYVGWRDYPTAYGPWWEATDARLAALAGDGVIANILAFKLFGILANAATVALIALFLRRTAPERALFGVTLFAWNPVVLYSSAGNAHNDALMVFLLILGMVLMARGRYTLSAMAITGGALVKFMPAMVFPIILVAAMKHHTTGRARVRYLVVTGLACAAMVLLTLIPFWQGPEVLTDDWRLHLFTTSVPAVVRATLLEYVSAETADPIVSRAAMLVLVLWVAGQGLALWRQAPAGRGQEWQPYVHACLATMLFYLLAACTWFEPWYTVWPIALAALLPDGVAVRGSVITALAATFKMPVLDFAMAVSPGNVPAALELECKITLATLTPAWLFFGYQACRGRGALGPSPAPAARPLDGVSS